MILPAALLVAVTLAFLMAERLWPGRPLPPVRGWYRRALSINFVQFAISLASFRAWAVLTGGPSLLHLSTWHLPAVEGLVGWFVATFVFYWWHRLRHWRGFWRVFHQLHHSPARIEVVTAFYKHPLEIFSDAILGGAVLMPLLGCSIGALAWFNLYAAAGEYFYHANLGTPQWLSWLVQTPEMHSIHHELDVHSFNFSDLPVWDRLFGTYRGANSFAQRCGFPGNAEQRVGAMLGWRDVYRESAASGTPMENVGDMRG